MVLRRFYPLLVLCLAATSVQAEPKQALITGYAYERGTDTLLYTENHAVMVDGADILDHQTDYRTPDGRTICTKSLNYLDQGFAPAFELRDLRDGYVEGAEYAEAGYRLYSRASADAPTKSDIVPLGNTLVSDAGFDMYVRARMDSLLAGNVEKFKMAIAAEQTVLSFQARMLEQTTLFGRPAIHIKVEPSTLLRLLVEPIYLTYDTENGELLRYEGLSNIRKANGKRHDTRIDFPPDQQKYVGLQRR